MPDDLRCPICVGPESAREAFRESLSGAVLAQGELTSLQALQARVREVHAPPPPDLVIVVEPRGQGTRDWDGAEARRTRRWARRSDSQRRS
eukprot:2179204-Pyramimonas_sp.AAC.1